MKRFPLLLLSILALAFATAAAADPPPPAGEHPWSVVGIWDGVHPRWTGPITFRPDGTLLGNWGEDMGQWLLHVQDGHVLVLLCGRDWPTETACVVGSDDLLGSVKDGLLRLHRRATGSAPAGRPPGFPVPPPTAFPLTGPLWSLVGTWDCTHGQDWTAPLTFQADGTFLKDGNAQGGGQWALCPQQDHVLLILRWNGWPAEVATLSGADEFHGSPEHGDLRMRRRGAAAPPAVATSPGPFIPTPSAALKNIRSTLGEPVEFRTWNQSEPPVRLIRQEEGFCALAKVTGHFQGSGESVRVYVAPDGYWYLGGTSHQEAVGAECIVVRYRK